MSSVVRVLAFSGSLRRGSWNQRLVACAARGAEAAGGEVEVISLRDYPMPLFDEDLEAGGTPEAALAFKAKMMGADGVLIASPEYNGSLSGALKNAIDWATRPAAGEAPLAAFRGKVCGLMSASPGGLGGIRGLLHLRPLLGNIMMHVLPEQHALGGAAGAFDDAGMLTDEGVRGKVEGIGARVVEVARALKG